MSKTLYSGLSEGKTMPLKNNSYYKKKAEGGRT